MEQYAVNVSELDEISLYRALGEAWYDQLKPKPGELYYLAKAEEIGRLEFDNAVRTAQLAGALTGDQLAKIRLASGWKMPASIMAELAARRAIIPVRNVPDSNSEGNSARS